MKEFFENKFSKLGYEKNNELLHYLIYDCTTYSKIHIDILSGKSENLLLRAKYKDVNVYYDEDINCFTINGQDKEYDFAPLLSHIELDKVDDIFVKEYTRDIGIPTLYSIIFIIGELQIVMRIIVD